MSTADASGATSRVDPPLWKGWGPLLLYHGVFLVAGLVLAPLVIWRSIVDRRYRAALWRRTGRVAPTDPDRRAVWVHGVSVGEVKGLATLIALIARDRPDLDVVVSATTPTGYELARRLYPDHRVVHYPLDFGLFPGRALDRVRPVCVLLMELEIWPNFLQAAARRGIPVAIVNGRISERSFRGYRMVRPLIPQLDWIELFCVQDGVYRDRLLALGVDPKRIAVTGNVKYDNLCLREPVTEAARLRDWLSADGRPVLVCGSTHGREDEWLADCATRVAVRRGAPIRVVVAPRHPERAGAVADGLRQRGHGFVRWSACGEALPVLDDRDVVVVDTIGQLEAFYGACDVAFVGGSLVPHGGQNMLEPAALGRAVLFGPHTANFRADVELLLGAGAAIQVEGVAALEVALHDLLADPGQRQELGRRAIDLIRRNQGATERTERLVGSLLSD